MTYCSFDEYYSIAMTSSFFTTRKTPTRHAVLTKAKSCLMNMINF